MKSKTSFLALLLAFLTFAMIAHAQDYKITFRVADSETPPDSVFVENLALGKSLMLTGSDTLNLVSNPVTINDLPANRNGLIVYPNPMNETAVLEFYNANSDNVTLNVYNMTGQMLASQNHDLPKGNTSFSLSGFRTGSYLVNITRHNGQSSTVVLSSYDTNNSPKVDYLGTAQNDDANTLDVPLKSVKIGRTVQMHYADGNMLRLVAYYNDKSAITLINPVADEGVDLKFFSYGTVEDYQGNVYKTIVIGSQTWMAENLRAITYADNTAIPQVSDATAWNNLGDNNTDKAYCFYNNDASLGYGALYTYAAATNGDNSGINVQGVCPNGWHLPNDFEWRTLEKNLGMSQADVYGVNFRGTNEGTQLKSTTGWNTDGNGTNTSGFSALPGGYCLYDGNFLYGGDQGNWWCSASYDASHGYTHYLYHDTNGVGRAYAIKGVGLSVRCVKGTEQNITTPSVTSTAASSITISSATIGGNVSDDGEAEVTDRGVEISSHSFSEGSGTLASSENAGVGEFTVEMGLLQAESTYYFRAYATNAAGTSYGAELTFTTTAPTTVTDYDGNSYNTIVIGTQTWMTEDLKTTNYPDGTAIPHIADSIAWTKLGDNDTDKGYCFYNNDAGLGYGALYTYAAATNGDFNGDNTQGACPDGWHLPSDDEWGTLEKYLGMSVSDAEGENFRGIDEGEKLKFTTGWNSDGNGTNTSGFAALAGGQRSSNGIFGHVGDQGYWWSSTLFNIYIAYSRNLQNTSNGVGRFPYDFSKSYGFSVRCIKNLEQTLTLPVVQSSSAVSVTHASAILGGNVSDEGGAPVSARGIEYSTSQNFTLGTGTQVADEDNRWGEYTIQLTNLPTETTYYFRAYATNEVGTSYGDELSFTTNASVTDIEGNSYNTIVIGTQTWMAENLRTAKYADGTTIPHVTDKTIWDNMEGNNTDKAYCFYNNNASLGYGALYTYAAATNGDNSNDRVQGVCPDGWYLPSDAEWKTLEMYLGMSPEEADKLFEWRGAGEGRELKSPSQWNGNNTDASGFNAIPGGYRMFDGDFSSVDDEGHWWTSTKQGGDDNDQAYYRKLSSDYIWIFRSSYAMSAGYSVRCLKGPDQNLTVPVLNTIAAVSVTETSATLGGNVSDGGGTTISARGVEYSMIQDFIQGTGTHVAAADAGLGEFTVPITKLQAKTTYYRAYATNEVGISYGEVLSFSTSAAASITVTDIDGNSYRTVKIGEQLWMAENLKTTQFANGTAIRHVTDNATWTSLEDNDIDKAYSFFNDDESLGYGALYTYAAATNSDNSDTNGQGVCPTGWYLPSDDDWNQLENYLAYNVYNYDASSGDEGNKIAKSLASTTGWWSSSVEGVIGNLSKTNNSSGFTALAGGSRDHSSGRAIGNSSSNWWSSTQHDSEQAKYFGLYYAFSYSFHGDKNKSTGVSVRCLKSMMLSSTAAESITKTSALLGGNISDKVLVAVTARGVEYSINPNFTQGTGTQVADVDAVAGVFTVQVAELQGGTTYYYRAYVTNAKGTNYGDELIFTTLIENTVSDIDGNSYNILEIGTQTWMTENLKVTKYADGISIPHVSDQTDWANLGDNDTDKAYCFYNNDATLGYGALYTYAAATNGDNSGINVQGACPTGWHLPSNDEWIKLENYLADNAYNYDGSTGGGKSKIAKAMASKTSWNSNINEGNVGNNPSSNNLSGFSGLASGYRYSDGSSQDMGNHCFLWSSTQAFADEANHRWISFERASLVSDDGAKSIGISVRCLKN